MSDMSELKKNVKAFEEMKGALLSEHLGKVALFHDGSFVDVYNDFDDAVKIGTEKFGIGKFSVKELTPAPRSVDFMGMAAVPVGI